MDGNHQSEQRCEIKEESKEDALAGCVDGGQRYCAGDRPGDDCRDHDSGIFQIDRQFFMIGHRLFAQLLGQHYIQRLITGKYTDEDRSKEDGTVGSDLLAEGDDLLLDAIEQTCFAEDT